MVGRMHPFQLVWIGAGCLWLVWVQSGGNKMKPLAHRAAKEVEFMIECWQSLPLNSAPQLWLYHRIVWGCSFLFLDIPHLVYSSVDGHFGWFYFWAIVNNTQTFMYMFYIGLAFCFWNISIQVFIWMFSIFLGIYLKAEWLEHSCKFETCIL